MRGLEQEIRGTVLFDEPMARHTSYRIGGAADIFVVPSDAEDLAKTLTLLRQRAIPVIILGRGTNLLVLDGGIRGCVVSMEAMTAIERTGETGVTAEAGAPLMEVVNRCTEWSLAGIENLAGIPGSVGGAIVMNAGAHGVYIESVVRSADILGADGTTNTKTRGELGFGYRTSALKDTEIIVRVDMEFEKGDPHEIGRIVREKLDWRRDRQPLSLPSAGSVFKNPPGMPAGKVITELGLKGTRVGGAEVSTLHGNFIVSRGGARAADVVSLIELIRKKAREERGIDLDPEIKIIGEDR